jgi:hypothetical protein
MSRIPMSPDFDQRLADWLEPDPTFAPPDILPTVVAAFPSIPQRRAQRAPWRLPAMTRFALVGAAAALVVVLGLGGLLLANRPIGPGVLGAPSPHPMPTPTAMPTPPPSLVSPSDVTVFVQARDQACARAATALGPLQSRFRGVWDGSLTRAEVTDWAAALNAFADGYDALLTELSALQPPPSLAADHRADIADLQSLRSIIRSEATSLLAGDLAEAKNVDATADPIGTRFYQRENEHGFTHCP